MLVWNPFIHDARVTREAEALATAGWNVTVVALHRPGETQQREVRNGWQVRRVPLLPALAVRARVHLVRIFRAVSAPFKRTSRPIERQGQPTRPNRPSWYERCRATVRETREGLAHLLINVRLFLGALEQRPGVIHAHDLNTLLPAFLAARLLGARLVYDAHEITVHQQGVQHRGWWRLVGRLLIPRVDAMFTTTEMRARWFSETYGIPMPVVLQNMVPYADVQPTRRLQEQLGLPLDEPIVLYQGGLQAGRGLENLVRAAALMRRGTVVLMGYGRLRHELDELARELGVRERITILDAVPLSELLSYTASATVGVQVIRNTCLNHYTTDSNKLFEYLMAGIPLVASDFPEIRRVVERYEVGLLVDPEQPEAIAGAINRLLEDHELYERMRCNTRRAARECSWETQAPRLLGLYVQLLRR